MKWILRTLGTLVGLLLIVVILEVVASESGEVVVLKTQDAAGEVQETRLWVVDHGEHAWLRSGSPQSGWYRRLKANPQVEVGRGSSAYTATAVAAPEAQAAINDLMLEKYGWADRYISLLFGREDAIPIRLER